MIKTLGRLSVVFTLFNFAASPSSADKSHAELMQLRISEIVMLGDLATGSPIMTAPTIFEHIYIKCALLHASRAQVIAALFPKSVDQEKAIGEQNQAVNDDLLAATGAAKEAGDSDHFNDTANLIDSKWHAKYIEEFGALIQRGPKEMADAILADAQTCNSLEGRNK